MIDNQSDCRNFTIYAAQMMLIGCLQREYLKKGLIFDVNSSTKSDLIGGTVPSGNSVSRYSGISCYSGYVKLTDCLF